MRLRLAKKIVYGVVRFRADERWCYSDQQWQHAKSRVIRDSMKHADLSPADKRSMNELWVNDGAKL